MPAEAIVTWLRLGGDHVVAVQIRRRAGSARRRSPSPRCRRRASARRPACALRRSAGDRVGQQPQPQALNSRSRSLRGRPAAGRARCEPAARNKGRQRPSPCRPARRTGRSRTASCPAGSADAPASARRYRSARHRARPATSRHRRAAAAAPRPPSAGTAGPHRAIMSPSSGSELISPTTMLFGTASAWTSRVRSYSRKRSRSGGKKAMTCWSSVELVPARPK